MRAVTTGIEIHSYRWRRPVRIVARAAVLVVLAFSAAADAVLAQSGAANGSVLVTVRDPGEGLVDGAQVSARNLDTSHAQVAVSRGPGQYEIALLPVGRYEVTVAAPGFAPARQSPVDVTSGQPALVFMPLSLAALQETVTVGARASVLSLDPGVRTTLNERAMENLPITSRNTHNLALFAAGITSRRDNEFGTPQIAFGGISRRGFMVDGMDNQQRAGQNRMGVFSTETIGELSVIHNAMAAEYGRTVGGIVSMVTRGGGNDWHGMLLVLQRRPGLTARPSLSVDKPFQQWATYSGSLSGPLRRDRAFFFANYEYEPIDAPRAITILPANAVALGLPAEELGTAPFTQRFRTLFGRGDYRASNRHYGFTRYSRFGTLSDYNSSGGLITKSSGNNFDDRQDSLASQWTSVLSPSLVSELRYGYLRRKFERIPVSGSIGPVIVITGVATLGSHAAAGERFQEDQHEVVYNLSWRRNAHQVKVGANLASINVDEHQRLALTFTFGGGLSQYLNTIRGVTDPATGRPFTYTQLQQQFGTNAAQYRTGSYNLYAQDDWRATPTLTISYGLRYELLDYPALSGDAPLPGSQAVPIDRNNVAPRLGASWQPTERWVVRGGYGMFYDTPNIRQFGTATINNGVRLVTLQIAGTNAAAPAFPQPLAEFNPGFGTRPSVTTFAQDFTTFYTHQANLQVEREIGGGMAVTGGYLLYVGRGGPLAVDVNVGAPTGTLADGRPTYGGVRPDARFNQILEIRSAGRSESHAGFFAVRQRFRGGLQFESNYTIGRATNNSEMSGAAAIASDPSDVERDLGLASADQRHRFVVQSVWESPARGDSPLARVAAGWLFAQNFTWSSGFPVNVVAGTDLNRDANNNDRPLSRARNDTTGPGFRELNARLSRRFALPGDRVRLEVIVEAENLLNETNAACGIGGCTGSVVNRDGAPDFLRVTSALNSRQVQFGGRLSF